MILLLDNYDSFVYNLARYLEELGERVEVRRNDALDVEGIRALAPEALVVSPGPCTPAEAGVSTTAIRELAGEVPILGVCLGHQCLAAAWDVPIVRARAPMHGKLSPVHHRGEGLFAGLPEPLSATRYHSLVVERDAVREPLRITAWTDEGEVMALAHRDVPAWGVQFHPEAVLTEGGHGLLANFLALARGEAPPGPAEADELSELPAGGSGDAGPSVNVGR